MSWYGESKVNLLCREVSSFRDTYGYDVKVDWKALAKSTSTGISKPLEYQMIWRHLFYKTPLLEKVEDGAEPLDDASDLEKEYAPVNEDSSEDTEDVSSDLAPVDEDLAEATKQDVSSGMEKECVPVNKDLAEATKPTNLNPVTGNRRHRSSKTHAEQKESSMAVNIPLSGTISTKFSGAKEEVSPTTSEASRVSGPRSLNDAIDGNQSVDEVNQSIKENTACAGSKSPVNGKGC